MGAKVKVKWWRCPKAWMGWRTRPSVPLSLCLSSPRAKRAGPKGLRGGHLEVAGLGVVRLNGGQGLLPRPQQGQRWQAQLALSIDQRSVRVFVINLLSVPLCTKIVISFNIKFIINVGRLRVAQVIQHAEQRQAYSAKKSFRSVFVSKVRCLYDSSAV